MKKTFGFLLVLFTLLIMSTPEATAHDYSDVYGHWAENTISDWVENGLVTGYQDSTFRPDNDITRAEVATLVSRFGLPHLWQEKTFFDVSPDSWYYDSIVSATKIGLMDGDIAGSFRPDDEITRKEAFKVAAMCWPKTDVNLELDFIDVDTVNDWAEIYVKTLIHYGRLSGYPDGSIRGNQNITRAEFVSLFSFILNIGQPEQHDTMENLNDLSGPSTWREPDNAVGIDVQDSEETTVEPNEEETNTAPVVISPGRVGSSGGGLSVGSGGNSGSGGSSGTDGTGSGSGDGTDSESGNISTTYRISIKIDGTTTDGSSASIGPVSKSYILSSTLLADIYLQLLGENGDNIRDTFNDAYASAIMQEGMSAYMDEDDTAWLLYVDSFVEDIQEDTDNSAGMKEALRDKQAVSYVGKGTWTLSYNVAQGDSGTFRQYMVTITIS